MLGSPSRRTRRRMRRTLGERPFMRRLSNNLAEDDDAFGDGAAGDEGAAFELPERADDGGFTGVEADLLGGARGAGEFHELNGAEAEAAAGLAGGETGSLRESLGEDDAGDDGIAGEVAGEERGISGKGFHAFRALAGLVGEDGIDEDERLAVGQAEGDGIERAHCFSGDDAVEKP